MPITDYPFASHYGPSRPLLPVALENPANGHSCQTWALVDTGADNSVIPGFLAEKLYHDVDHKSVRRGRSTGIGGQVDIFYHSFRICILGLDNRGTITEDIAIKIHKREYAVVPELRVMLLGVSDFLTKYVLSINYPKKLFSVRSQH